MFEFFLSDNNSTSLEEMIATIDNQKINDYKIHFQSNYQHSKTIRDFVGAIFDHFFIHHPWRGRFILITDELINNSIEHGSKNNDTNACYIRVGREESGDFHISLEVHDTGKKQKNKLNHADFEKIKHDRTQNQNNEIYMEKRGRGLFHITEKIVDTISFSESPIGGLAVKIEKSIQTENQNYQNNSCENSKNNEPLPIQQSGTSTENTTQNTEQKNTLESKPQ